MADDGWRLGHRPGLDGLRGIAVVFVLIFHWWPHTFVGGETGVNLFFVLSGFLITRLLLEERWNDGRVDLRGFYARRVRRLMPASLAVTVVCIGTPGVLWVLVYSANWGRIDGALQGGPLEHFWSLAVEEQFYAAWPVVLLVLLRLRIAFPVTVIAIGLVMNHRVGMEDDGDVLRMITGTDTRMDSLLIGCAGAMALPWLLRFTKWGLAALAVTPVCIMGLFGVWPYMRLTGYTVNALAWLVVLVWALHSRSFLVSPWLRKLGAWSYSLYLWHYPVTWVIRDGDLAANGTHVGTLLAIILSFAAAVCSYELIENRWRQRARAMGPPRATEQSLARARLV